jgi:tetratricopeptide (TPR) repeat protein
VASDCVFKAYMSYKDDSLVGLLKNVDVDIISYDIRKDDIRKILINVDKNILTIIEINTFGLCALGSNFLGNYSKVSPKNIEKFEKKLASLLELLSSEEKKFLLNSRYSLKELYKKSLQEYKQKKYSLAKEELSNNGIHLYLNLYALSEQTLSIYNDLAYFLEKAKAYKESAFLLEKIIEKFPNRTVAYYNLGDAYWGLNDKIKAKQAYQTYIKQMKESGKEKKIPQVVLERVK